ncbi:MAG: glycoside hydrolase family 16 protein [Thermoleophilia bacterium]
MAPHDGGVLHDEFDGSDLDRRVWLPHYLPAWSSREATRASYRTAAPGLLIELPPGAGAWCPGEHEPPLRVSGIQSGNFSGPVGSTAGQQPYRDGLTVREKQPRFEGHLQRSGRLAVRCRMGLSPRSMAALWLVGFEDRPERCGEICVVEVFGRALDGGRSAEVGMGLHAFRDPDMAEDFAAPRLPIDVAEPHEYAVEWDAESARFTVDGDPVRACARPPTYPMQIMAAVFDFPEWSAGGDGDLVPWLRIDRIEGVPAG